VSTRVSVTRAAARGQLGPARAATLSKSAVYPDAGRQQAIASPPYRGCGAPGQARTWRRR
jgi:hypothetical protein